MVTPQTERDIDTPAGAQKAAPAVAASAPAAPRDAYATLQIRSTASRTLVEQTYWRLAEQAQRRTGPGVAAHLAALNAAYSTLIDSSRRAAYDAAYGFTPGTANANADSATPKKQGGLGRLFARTVAAVAPHEPSPYEVLHVADDASQDVIELAFVVQRLALKDAKLDHTDAMLDLERAHARIATSELRAAFDAGLPPPAAAPGDDVAPEVSVEAVTIDPQPRDDAPERPHARITFLRPRRKPEPVAVADIVEEPPVAGEAATAAEPSVAPIVAAQPAVPVADRQPEPESPPDAPHAEPTPLADAPAPAIVAAQPAVPVAHRQPEPESTQGAPHAEPAPLADAPAPAVVAAQLAAPVLPAPPEPESTQDAPHAEPAPLVDAPAPAVVAAQLAVPVLPAPPEPESTQDAPHAEPAPLVDAPAPAIVAAQLAVPVSPVRLEADVPVEAPAAASDEPPLPPFMREPVPAPHAPDPLAVAATIAPAPAPAPVASEAVAESVPSRGGLLGRFRGRKQSDVDRTKATAAEDDRLLSLREVLASVPPPSRSADALPEPDAEVSAIPASAYLAFTGGMRSGTRMPLYGDAVTLGTSLSANIILPDDTGRVARDHARIWRQGDSYFFRQLDGFGSLIGGRDLDMPVVVLEEGDEIAIGAHTLRFTLE